MANILRNALRNNITGRKKIYYTNGQITKGLYTEGKEWMLVDGTEYIGDYHTYSTGEVYTKSEYIQNVSKKLIRYLNISDYNIKKVFEYDSLKSAEAGKLGDVVYSKLTPLESDYSNGSYTRYFVKRHFQKLITEVNADSFANASDEFYNKLELKWKLTGPLNDTIEERGVYDTNRRLVLLAEKEMVGIRNYVTDYTEYARISL